MERVGFYVDVCEREGMRACAYVELVGFYVYVGVGLTFNSGQSNCAVIVNAIALHLYLGAEI